MAKKKKSPAKKPGSQTVKKPKKSAPAPSLAAKVKPPVSTKPSSAPKARPAAKPGPAAKSRPTEKSAATRSSTMEKPSRKTVLRDSILKRKAALKPIVFSLDEVRAIAKTVTSKTNLPFAGKTKAPVKKAAALPEKALKPQHVKAASLADILGFNPKKGRKPDFGADKIVPEKYRRYYKLLIDLRTHLTEGIERHSEETLKRSAKDDAGDLSAYGQHMADAGTDTFDRDFALSMVASEQEALAEIDAAIKRIDAGTYGICEITQKPIAKERLLAVPFTRYTAEAQKNLERNRHRSRSQAGLFGEMGEDGAKIMDDDSRGDD